MRTIGTQRAPWKATAGVWLALGTFVVALAQEARPQPPVPRVPGNGGNLPNAAAALPVPPAPPLPPPSRPPVEFFRELLAASPARRAQLLEGKPAAAREVIERRLAEFEGMEPEARSDAEWRLRLAEFRFYLTRLLNVPPGERPSRLAQAPAADRPLLEERLKAWDALSEDARRQVLESQQQFHHFVQQPSADPARLAQALSVVPIPSQADVEAQFARWRALPEAERRQRSATFQAVFDLPHERRSKALQGLSLAERTAMERSLERFSKLPTAERDRCIAGLERLARLAPPEREAFLRNAALWQAMSPGERDQWRRLVFNLRPPPLPVPIPHAGRPALVSTNR